LRGDGTSFGVDRGIGGADHNRVITQQIQKIIQPQSDLQIDVAFKDTGTGGCAAVDAAVTGIHNDPAGPGNGTVLNGNGYAIGAKKGKTDTDQGRKEIHRKPFFHFGSIHGQHLRKYYAPGGGAMNPNPSFGIE